MKYIIVDNQDVIIHVSDTIGYQENGNVLVDNDTLAIAKPLVKEIYEVSEVPENIAEQKYCYTKKQGFYENVNYREPEPTQEEKIAQLQEQITDLQLALTEMYEGGM